MRRWILLGVWIGAFGALPGLSRAEVGPYTGEWAYQALNTKDTHFKVEQKGSELILYRILFPDPGDPSYRLEHLFKGKLEGKKVTGKMFVREQALADFEFLRAFSGEIVGKDRMVIDDLPLERFAGADAAPPVKVTIQREDKPAASKPIPITPKTPGEEAVRLAPRDIPSLTPVSMRIPVETLLKVETLIKEADQRFESKRYQDAASRYMDALKLDPQKVEILYKLGWSYGTLGSLAERKKDPKRAAAFFRLALEYWEKAFRYDPYNRGTKENIRRAKEKLSKVR